MKIMQRDWRRVRRKPRKKAVVDASLPIRDTRHVPLSFGFLSPRPVPHPRLPALYSGMYSVCPRSVTNAPRPAAECVTRVRKPLKRGPSAKVNNARGCSRAAAAADIRIHSHCGGFASFDPRANRDWPRLYACAYTWLLALGKSKLARLEWAITLEIHSRFRVYFEFEFSMILICKSIIDVWLCCNELIIIRFTLGKLETRKFSETITSCTYSIYWWNQYGYLLYENPYPSPQRGDFLIWLSIYLTKNAFSILWECYCCSGY